MPLHAVDGKPAVVNGFRYRRGRSVLGEQKSLTETAETLVVGTVDNQRAAIESMQKGIMDNGGIVKLVPVLILVERSLLHVLDDGAAEKNIDNLHALADTEYRLTAAQCLFHGFKLNDIQLCVYIFGAVIFLPEKSRRNVAAARQKHAAAGVNPVRRKCGNTGNSQTGKRSLIVSSVLRPPDDGDCAAAFLGL